MKIIFVIKLWYNELSGNSNVHPTRLFRLCVFLSLYFSFCFSDAVVCLPGCAAPSRPVLPFIQTLSEYEKILLSIWNVG